MKGRVGRTSRAITREILQQITDAFGTDTSGDTSGTAASTEDRQRRARRAAYAEKALRQQQAEGRRIREAYRRAQAGAARGEARHAAGGTSQSDGASQSGGPRRQTADQGARTSHYRGRVVPDYYDALEVSPRARQSVIDKAYRALMREDHPDQGGDARRAQLLNEAHEVLSDPVRRREYDRENGLG